MNQKQHIKIDKIFLGYSIPEIHSLLDTIKSLKQHGSGHRKQNHNYIFLKYIKENYGQKCHNIALLHLLIDLQIIGTKEYINQIIKKF